MVCHTTIHIYLSYGHNVAHTVPSAIFHGNIWSVNCTGHNHKVTISCMVVTVYGMVASPIQHGMTREPGPKVPPLQVEWALKCMCSMPEVT